MHEFYHSGLQNTRRRNAGQTTSKWTGRGAATQNRSKREPTMKVMPEHGWLKVQDDTMIIMVDQVWIWALDEYTLVSCFPTGKPLYDQGASYAVGLDVMASAISFEDLKKCQDIVDLLALLVHRSINRIFEEYKTQYVDMLSIYRWAAANKVFDGLNIFARHLRESILVLSGLIVQAARHSKLLEAFSTRQPNYITGRQASEGREELDLILDCVDILEELNILMLLFEKQASVVSDIQREFSSIKSRKPQQNLEPPKSIHVDTLNGDLTINAESFQTHVGDVKLGATSELLGEYAGDLARQAVDRLQVAKAETKRLQIEVKQTHGLLRELLDLEQATASLEEARLATVQAHVANEQARVATTQGRAVMLFTIVTIIFLPLSFFTSYFGQNVVEFTGDDQNPKASEVWKVGAPISVAVIVASLIIALFIMSSWARWQVRRAADSVRRTLRKAKALPRQSLLPMLSDVLLRLSQRLDPTPV